MRVMPASMRRRHAHRRAPAMTAVIERMAVRTGFEVTVGGRQLIGVELDDGTPLLGEAPRKGEGLTFDWLAEETGLSVPILRTKGFMFSNICFVNFFTGRQKTCTDKYYRKISKNDHR